MTDCGGGLRLRPLDMAKIGYLVLKNGRWGNRPIVSENWIETSFQDHTPAVFHFNYKASRYTSG